WTAQLRQLARPHDFNALDRREVGDDIGRILKSAVTCGAFALPALASAAQAANANWPKNAWANIVSAFITAVQGAGRTVDEATNATLVATLADALDGIESASSAAHNEINTGKADPNLSGSAEAGAGAKPVTEQVDKDTGLSPSHIKARSAYEW